jgi:uncharacterized integral membrane protein
LDRPRLLERCAGDDAVREKGETMIYVVLVVIFLVLLGALVMFRGRRSV